MRPRRSRLARRLLAIAVIALAVEGCTFIVAGAAGGAAVGAIASPLPDTSASPHVVGAAVHVEFVTPRPRIAARGADSLALGPVRYATGRVVMHRGDSLWIRVTELRADHARPAYYARHRAPVLGLETASEARVRVISRVPEVAETAWTGAAVSALFGLIATVIALSQLES